jgi:hypothetical protein
VGYPAPGADPGAGTQEWTHPDTGEVFDGYRAYDGGSGVFAGADANHNHQLLMPNRVVRTFQGYGSDNFDVNGEPIAPGDDGYVSPMDDGQLVQTGVWMIDRVVFGVDGMITIECRDVGKVLLEQFVYPDMIPMERFPLIYCEPTSWTEERVVQEEGTPGANVISGPGAPSGAYVSGNDPHYGSGGSVFGHRVRDAFDGDTSTYWLSVGNASPTADFAFEYITGATLGNRFNQVVVNTVSTGYWCYVSVHEDGQWLGSETIPYNPDASAAFPNGANIPYVRRFTISDTGNNVLNLPGTYNADFVRVTFHRLWNSNLGTYPYRAAVRTSGLATGRPNNARNSRRTISVRRGSLSIGPSRYVNSVAGLGSRGGSIPCSTQESPQTHCWAIHYLLRGSWAQCLVISTTPPRRRFVSASR